MSEKRNYNMVIEFMGEKVEVNPFELSCINCVLFQGIEKLKKDYRKLDMDKEDLDVMCQCANDFIDFISINLFRVHALMESNK